jgi:hypothetical protein
LSLWDDFICRFPIFINSGKGVISIGILSADNIDKDNVGCHGILLLLPKLLLLEIVSLEYE